jgi:hypothetical protein
MKKFILSFALMVGAGATFAQLSKPVAGYVEHHRSAIMFDFPTRHVNIRDIARLKNPSEAVMFELHSVRDYSRLKGLSLLLKQFDTDIQFYKDSLANLGSGNVRIDYAIWVDSTVAGLDDRAEIRFKKYAPDGDMYYTKRGEVARLKIAQDTINFIIRTTDTTKTGTTMLGPTLHVSFFLNNYADLDKIAQDGEMLDQIVDTFRSTKKNSTVNDPYKFPSSSIYRPYAKGHQYRFQRYNGILDLKGFGDNNAKPMEWSDKLTLTLNMGTGLIRNTFTPMAEASISIYSMRAAFHSKDADKHEINNYASLGISPYFFFDRAADGKFYIKDNWFTNFEIGTASNFMGINSPLLTGGIGYLTFRKGDYFRGTTMKAFISVKMKNSITICPEVIFTNNFKQIFPGFTIKFF